MRIHAHTMHHNQADWFQSTYVRGWVQRGELALPVGRGSC